jgi:hypothetical protein
MASISLKVAGSDQTFDFPWFNEDLGRLLGNPRPSTLQDIEKNEYWANLFHDYCYAKGAGPRHAAWVNASDKERKDGPQREALKETQVQTDTVPVQTLGVREAFRVDLGLVKAVYREKEKQDKGLGEEINDTFGLNTEEE